MTDHVSTCRMCIPSRNALAALLANRVLDVRDVVLLRGNLDILANGKATINRESTS